MAALVKHHHCGACGKRHHFTLPTGDLSPDRHYDYVCPETGQKTEFRPTAPSERVPHPPQGAVQLVQRQD